MKNLLGSLPARLVLGVIVGIIVGLYANELCAGDTDLQKSAGVFDHLLCAADHHRLYRSIYYAVGHACLYDAACRYHFSLCFFP